MRLPSYARSAFEFRNEFLVILNCFGTLDDVRTANADGGNTQQKKEKADSPSNHFESAWKI